jgi:hypothetical protein
MEEGLIDVGAIQLLSAQEVNGQDTVRVALNVLDHPDSGFLVVRQPLSEEVTVARVFVRKARQVSHSWRIKSQVETVVNDAIAKLFEYLRDGEDGSGRLMVGSEVGKLPDWISLTLLAQRHSKIGRDLQNLAVSSSLGR